MAKYCYLLLALMPLLATGRAFSQGVRGIVVGTQDRLPIHGAFVTLLDHNSHQRGAALTDSAGRFFVRVSRPGTYTLRAERIGYESVTSAPIQLTTDTITYHFQVPTEPIVLEGIAVSRDRSCRRRPDATAVYQLWRAINTALRITVFSQQSTSMQFELFRYSRELARDGRSLLSEERNLLSVAGAFSFSTLDPSELASGFLRAESRGSVVYGPDAMLLVSDEFQDTHCFGLVRGNTPGTIGLSFGPMKTQPDVIDVKGVLWADARSGELRSLTFEYTNFAPNALSKDLKGEVEFRKLASGHWIVQKWWIRGSLYAARVIPRGYLNVFQLGIHEEGGHVVSVDGRVAMRGSGVLEGVVVDSLAQLPVSDALVFTSILPYQAKTDSLGRYRIEGIPAGTYEVAVATPTQADMRERLRLYEVRVPHHGEAKLNLVSPTDPTVFKTACANTRPDIGTAIVFGTARDSASRLPLEGAEIWAEWRGPSLRNPKIANHSRRTQSGVDGRYYLCWLPGDRTIVIKARTLRKQLGTLDVQLNDVTRLKIDFPVRKQP
jgi:hypothetical protein